MTNEEAKKMLKAKLECLKNETSGINHDCNMRLCDGCLLNYDQGNMGEQQEALEIAVKAVERIGHLIDRPCEACEYHKETGCSQWSCVFEEVNADEEESENE